MAYQTFKDRRGASNSSGKLEKLRLPDMKGKRFLDLGCNEGFFCGHALEQGAVKAVGVEKNKKSFEAAKIRHPAAEFLNQSWDDEIPGEFDVVLFSSALHYAKDKGALLEKIHGLLQPDGLLVLECGVAPGEEMKEVETYRRVGTVMHPTRSLLMRYLEKYAVTDMGDSVQQTGDPVPRFVFHCRKASLRSVVFLSGESGRGKSTLAKSLFAEGRLSLDFLMREYERDVLGEISKSVHVSALVSRIDNEGRWDELLEFMGNRMKKARHSGRHTLVLDGDLLSHPVARNWFRAHFSDIPLWSLMPMAGGIPVTSVNEIRLFDADPDVVEVANPKLFKRRPDRGSFVLHPPAAPDAWSKAAWHVKDLDGHARFTCQLSLPHKGSPVELRLILTVEGETCSTHSIEIRPGEYRAWTVDIGRSQGRATVSIQSRRAPDAASNAKAWLVLHLPRLID